MELPAPDFHENPSTLSNEPQVTVENSQCPPNSPPQKAGVISKIEAIFAGIAEGLTKKDDDLSITLRIRGATVCGRDDRVRRVRFPGKTAEEAWRFAVIVRILEIMYEALRADVIVSKRDIYYRDPALFGAQAHVDRYVDDIACTFGVSRSSVGVVAAAKGLVAGAVHFYRRDGSMNTANIDSEGILVPNLREVLAVNMSAVKWILVIEKEATFRTIASSSFWARRASQGIIITGKGYPDIATRAVLRLLGSPSPRNSFLSPPVFGLVDYDPDGLAILLTYKHGSKALAHESSELRLPSVQWLGLRSHHLPIGDDGTQSSQGLLSLSTRDRKKARALLEMQFDLEDQSGTLGYRNELRHMLMLNVKAELQLLHATPNSLIDLLERELAGL